MPGLLVSMSGDGGVERHHIKTVFHKFWMPAAGNRRKLENSSHEKSRASLNDREA